MTKTPEQMAEEWTENNDECEFARDAFLAGYQAAKDQFADVDKVMPQWISVKERLPEAGVEVLIFGKVFNDISKILGVRARFNGDQSWKYTWESEDIHIYMQDDVTHWMPLPEAPKQ